MSVRKNIRRESLTEAGLAKEMRRVLPKRNNYCPVNYTEIAKEARDLGLTTVNAQRSHIEEGGKREEDGIHQKVHGNYSEPSK